MCIHLPTVSDVVSWPRLVLRTDLSVTIAEAWGYGNQSLLSSTHSLHTHVHASNHLTNSQVKVVSRASVIANTRGSNIQTTYCSSTLSG